LFAKAFDGPQLWKDLTMLEEIYSTPILKSIDIRADIHVDIHIETSDD
jgi:hypothetical protein